MKQLIIALVCALSACTLRAPGPRQLTDTDCQGDNRYRVACLVRGVETGKHDRIPTDQREVMIQPDFGHEAPPGLGRSPEQPGMNTAHHGSSRSTLPRKCPGNFSCTAHDGKCIDDHGRPVPAKCVSVFKSQH